MFCSAPKRRHHSTDIAVLLWYSLLFIQELHASHDHHIHRNTSCLSDTDSFGHEWNVTNNGQIITISCPEGSTGNISRECIVIEDIDTLWNVPNVECSNDLIRDKAKQAKGVLFGGNIGLPDIGDILNRMHDVTYIAFVNRTFFPSDLMISADILLDITTTIGSTNDINQVGDTAIESLVQAYAYTVNTLVDYSTFHVWRGFFVTYDLVKTATELLQSTELLAFNLLQLRMLSTTTRASESEMNYDSFTWTRLSATADNLDIEMCVIRDGQAAHLRAVNGASSITFPPNLIGNLNSSGMIGLYRAQFQSVSLLFNDEDMRPPVTWLVRNASMSPARSLNSVILSAKVIVSPSHDIELRSASIELPDPVILVFQHTYPADPGYRGVCYYLNETAVLLDDPVQRWSPDGCETINSNRTHTSCRCYHLTSFALIMDLYETSVADVHQVALGYLSYIGGALSIAGCSLSVITYKLCKLTNERIYIHEMLAMSIVATQMTFFVGFERTEYEPVCRVFAILLHFSLVAMFSWMLIEGIHLYISLVKVFRRGPLFKKYCCFGFGLPLINVTISVAIFYDHYAVNGYCWLSNQVLFITFLPFVIITVLVNCIVLTVTLRVIVRSKNNVVRAANEDISSIKVGFKATVVLLPLLGITWFFAFISTGHDATLVFTYMFTICNSMQGVFFYGFHCLMNAEVQTSLRRLWISASGSGSSAGSGVNSEVQLQPVGPVGPGVDNESQPSQHPSCFFVCASVDDQCTVNEGSVDKATDKATDAEKTCELYIHTDLPSAPACFHRSAGSLDTVATDVTIAAFNEPDSPPPLESITTDSPQPPQSPSPQTVLRHLSPSPQTVLNHHIVHHHRQSFATRVHHHRHRQSSATTESITTDSPSPPESITTDTDSPPPPESITTGTDSPPPPQSPSPQTVFRHQSPSPQTVLRHQSPSPQAQTVLRHHRVHHHRQSSATRVHHHRQSSATTESITTDSLPPPESITTDSPPPPESITTGTDSPPPSESITTDSPPPYVDTMFAD